ncbi:unnamed protein product [Diplocarpon coronariae]|uniref:Uncharacterized protein n=1 Tax=Diplocarpon coronariae TaxID=2795749 RepID=A0A218ZD92_9HELO|nr:hypothetical protein B2J93_6311 [Marssonina coronariae]
MLRRKFRRMSMSERSEPVHDAVEGLHKIEAGVHAAAVGMSSPGESSARNFMCLETTTTYETCAAVRTHLHVCASHIAHTRLQLDNEPCPALRRKVQNPGHKGWDRCRCRCSEMPHGCERSRSRGYGEGGSTWGFEKEARVSLKGTTAAAAEQEKEGGDQNHDQRPRGSGGHWEEKRERGGAANLGSDECGLSNRPLHACVLVSRADGVSAVSTSREWRRRILRLRKISMARLRGANHQPLCSPQKDWVLMLMTVVWCRRKTRQSDGAPLENDEAIVIPDGDRGNFVSALPHEDFEMGS